MPSKPAHPCRQPGCPELTHDKSGYCPRHKKAIHQQYDRERGSAASRGYGRRWQKASKMFLARHPLCALCARKDPPVIRAATLVDHIKPHRGDMALFWDENNWQPSCDECHNIKTATEDGAFGNVRK